MLRNLKGQRNISLISSSQRNIEVLHKKLSDDESIMYWYSEIKLVPIEEIEHKMDDSACKSFVKMQSNNGFHSAGIIFIKRSWESILERYKQARL
ncbi:unnamed protein product [Cuscuta campestris]|uniref:Uncharacterized protein n=1 Tax=Cuscuta campestris TaxID=132261 RepID=A0A484KA13_9ASTE|nr:unnamed protein product [Cuscuta campestris]